MILQQINVDLIYVSLIPFKWHHWSKPQKLDPDKYEQEFNLSFDRTHVRTHARAHTHTHTHISQRDAMRVVEDVVQRIRFGEKCVLHCRGGVGRAGVGVRACLCVIERECVNAYIF
jgi:protein-tyrosine phosphatase